ncbi:MAG TPA: glutamine synthetase family protein [Acidimicrobiales bacterium]|nr:glutamine synthetase family protein [Acidimicrobiales bacterium]
MSGLRGMLTLDELRDAVADGSIDTVLVAATDLQGRLVGKRVTGWFFLEEIAEHSVEACNYLLAVDVEMTPLPGYTFANWDTGYGDISLVPDLSTMRLVPWLEATALVLCDIVDEADRSPIAVSPRQILSAQVERARAAGFAPAIGAELEFFLFRDSYAELAERRFADPRPHSDWIEDYHIFQTTRDEYVIRRIRNAMDACGIPVEFSKGEAGYGQHEINLRFADALEMADRQSIYKNAVREIADQEGRSVTFMAKYSEDDVGSSCHLHISLTDVESGETVFDTPAGTSDGSVRFRHFLGGIIAASRDLALCWAPTLNSYKRYAPESWAPTAIAWGTDNRTCGYRIVGHGSGTRLESRIPGADVNGYIAYAALIAAGIRGIELGIDPPPPTEGNAYEADVPRIPSTFIEAIEAFASSEVAVEIFGEAVHHHLLNSARQEWLAANRAVTDWERRRYFAQF